MTDKLPSIDDFYEELPSKDEVIKEEKLPSINEFVEEEEEEVVEEKNKCKEGEYFCNDEQKCKPIPDGHTLDDSGYLVKETATAGATSAGNIASISSVVGAKRPIKKAGRYGAPKAPQKLMPDGTAKNALDVSNNIMGGKAIKR